MEERRGRPKEIIHEPPPIKFERRYEDEYAIETWKFNLKKQPYGPIEVDIKYKAGAEKTLKLRAKEAKQEKKLARQMKKINNANCKKN